MCTSQVQIVSVEEQTHVDWCWGQVWSFSGLAMAGAVGDETEGERRDANVLALARMLALAGGVDLEVGKTVPTERCMIVFCLPNPPLPTPIFVFPLRGRCCGRSNSVLRSVAQTHHNTPTHNGADPLPLLSLAATAAAPSTKQFSTKKIPTRQH